MKVYYLVIPAPFYVLTVLRLHADVVVSLCECRKKNKCQRVVLRAPFHRKRGVVSGVNRKQGVRKQDDLRRPHKPPGSQALFQETAGHNRVAKCKTHNYKGFTNA